MSRNSRLSASGIAGIGWSEKGITNTMICMLMLKQIDMHINGAVFNQALLSVHVERQRVANVKPNHAIALTKQCTVPCDDLGQYETMLDDPNEQQNYELM
jgi:hypothetical protein